MIHKKPQPGKIGTKLWVIFDPAVLSSLRQ
jgi:hypothetical protein